MMKTLCAALGRRERWLWLGSVVLVTAANVLCGEVRVLMLLGTLVGVTALIFLAVGNVWGQILTVVFAVLYAVAAWEYRYYGEMITYLGMTLPMAVLAAWEWWRNPYEKGKNVVRIAHLTGRKIAVMLVLTVVVTAVFYVILRLLDTPNLALSTVSITTSFLAAYLTYLRSSYYALAYAANDVVLMGLWILAALDDVSNAPLIVCFGMFLVNDLYGFVKWKQREGKQAA